MRTVLALGLLLSIASLSCAAPSTEAVAHVGQEIAQAPLSPITLVKVGRAKAKQIGTLVFAPDGSFQATLGESSGQQTSTVQGSFTIGSPQQGANAARAVHLIGLRDAVLAGAIEVTVRPKATTPFGSGVFIGAVLRGPCGIPFPIELDDLVDLTEGMLEAFPTVEARTGIRSFSVDETGILLGRDESDAGPCDRVHIPEI